MKKFPIILTTMLLLTATGYAQVAINKDGNSPDPSAMLDVKATEGGVLIPRMTKAERDAINGGTFATGLLIYQTDNTPGYYYYDGSAWQRIVGGADSDWTISGNDMYSAVIGNVGIGTYTPDTLLDVEDAGNPIVTIQTSTTSSREARLKLKGARTTSETEDIAAIEFHTWIAPRLLRVTTIGIRTKRHLVLWIDENLETYCLWSNSAPVPPFS